MFVEGARHESDPGCASDRQRGTRTQRASPASAGKALDTHSECRAFDARRLSVALTPSPMIPLLTVPLGLAAGEWYQGRRCGFKRRRPSEEHPYPSPLPSPWVPAFAGTTAVQSNRATTRVVPTGSTGKPQGGRMRARRPRSRWGLPVDSELGPADAEDAVFAGPVGRE